MLFQLAQKTLITLLKVKNIIILTTYFDFTNIFLCDFIAELLKYININNYSINLVDNKQLPNNLIYSKQPVKLEILKAYIKTNLIKRFIQSFNLLISTLILFV